MKRRTKVAALVVALALVAGGTYVYQSTLQGNGDNATTEEAAVREIAPQPGVVAVEIDAPALIRPLREVTLRSPAGGQLTFVGEEGETVTEGTVVARLDDTDLRMQLERSRLDFSEARLSLQRAQADAERARRELVETQRLFDAGGVSREQLEKSEESLANAVSNVEIRRIAEARARLSVERDETNLARAEMRSPFDGIIMGTSAGAGDSIGTNAAVVTVAQVDQVRVTSEIDEFDVARIQPGMTTNVRIEAVAGSGAGPFTGTVERVSPAAQVVSNISVFTVTTIIDNPDALLRPGMSADLVVAIARDEGLVIPARAITTVRTRNYVDVKRLNEAGEEEVETVRVTIGATDGVQTVVLDGLTEDDRLVVTEQTALNLPTLAPPDNTSNGILPISVPGSSGAPGGTSGGGGGGGAGR